MELNKVILIGNLTRDPETRTTSGGAMVVKMGLASNRRTGSGENRREEVLYVDVEAWNRTAELCSQYLRKGSQVLVEGRLKLDQYQTQAGEKRNKLFIVADRVQFGSRADSASDGGGYSSQGKQSSGSSYQPSGSSQDDFSQDSNSGSGPDTEDDLPF